MKRFIYSILLPLFVLTITNSCSPSDDDFFAGQKWYITGLCQGGITKNLLMQYGSDGKPSTTLSQAWQKDVLQRGEDRYCIRFSDNHTFTLQTEHRAWNGTVSYDLSSRKMSFRLSAGTVAQSDLEQKVREFLERVVGYSGNRSYMHFNQNTGDFILLYPTRGDMSAN